MKIRSAVTENGCLVFFDGQKNKKKQTKKRQKKNKKNICKTYTHPPHRRLRKRATLDRWVLDDSSHKADWRSKTDGLV